MVKGTIRLFVEELENRVAPGKVDGFLHASLIAQGNANWHSAVAGPIATTLAIGEETGGGGGSIWYI